MVFMWIVASIALYDGLEESILKSWVDGGDVAAAAAIVVIYNLEFLSYFNACEKHCCVLFEAAANETKRSFNG